VFYNRTMASQHRSATSEEKRPRKAGSGRPQCWQARNSEGIANKIGDLTSSPEIHEQSKELVHSRVNVMADPEFSVQIPQELRSLALSQREFACFMCGAAEGETDPYDPSKQIHLHVSLMLNRQDGGSDELSNLRALCSVCNEGAQNISPKRPEWVDLLVQLRRAPALDQVEALKWLMKKFPAQTRANLPDPGK